MTSTAVVISNLRRWRVCGHHVGLARLLPTTHGDRGLSSSPSKRDFSSLLKTPQTKNFLLPTSMTECHVPPARSMSLESAQQSFHVFYFGCLKSAPVTLVMEQLCAVHDATGLPWWAAIVMTTVTLRGLLMFPACVTSQKVFISLDKYSTFL